MDLQQNPIKYLQDQDGDEIHGVTSIHSDEHKQTMNSEGVKNEQHGGGSEEIKLKRI